VDPEPSRPIEIERHGCGIINGTAAVSEVTMREDLHVRAGPAPRPDRNRNGALLLCALLFAGVLEAQAAPLPPTPSQTEGPFYPRTLPAERDADLVTIAGHNASAQGTLFYFDGRVLTVEGTPVAGAKVELWQADRFGRYHHAGDDGQPRDDDFQGYGVATTDAAGHFAFRTIRPVPYGGRPPHLHLKVNAAGHPELTTQLYMAGDRTDGDFVLAQSPKGTLSRLSVTLVPLDGREPGALQGTFDIVLR
jgi:protocatechuate 3,4-dioxygenase beta subunit